MNKGSGFMNLRGVCRGIRGNFDDMSRWMPLVQNRRTGNNIHREQQFLFWYPSIPTNYFLFWKAVLNLTRKFFSGSGCPRIVHILHDEIIAEASEDIAEHKIKFDSWRGIKYFYSSLL